MAVDTEDVGIGWYFKKNEEHTVPPLDACISYITEYDGYYADVDAKEDDPVIYLTFDAGYENGNIEKTLDILKAHDVHGAFFVLAHLIKSNPALIKRMWEEGHLVCNHTANHPDTTKLTRDAFCAELSLLEETYREVTGCELAPYFRPPEGKFNRTTLSYAKEAGYKTVFWSLAYPDWDNTKQPDPQKAKETLLSHTHNGMVLLLHPTSDTNVQILGELIDAWRAEGYRFGTLDELTGGETK